MQPAVSIEVLHSVFRILIIAFHDGVPARAQLTEVRRDVRRVRGSTILTSVCAMGLPTVVTRNSSGSSGVV